MDHRGGGAGSGHRRPAALRGTGVENAAARSRCSGIENGGVAMSNLLVRPHAPDTNGCVLDITPKSAGWQSVGFRVHHLRALQIATGGETGRETCLLVLKGTADISVEHNRFEGIGGRLSVFDDAAPGAVYVPAGMRFKVTAHDAVELAVSQTRHGNTGRRNGPRRDLLPSNEPVARLRVSTRVYRRSRSRRDAVRTRRRGRDGAARLSSGRSRTRL